MRILPVDAADPSADRLAETVTVLRDGGLVALPTETLYGIAADIASVEALARINRLKRKSERSPLLLLLADVSQAYQVAKSVPGAFHRLAELFWPGPLTLVVPAVAGLPVEITGSGGTVALRVPGLEFPRRVAALLSRPITGVSANLHGAAPCGTAAEVIRNFPEGLDLVLDGGAAAEGTASTLLDLCETGPRILRPGPVATSSLQSVLPDLIVEPL